MCIFIAYMSCSSKCKDSKIQSRFREMGVLDIQAGVAMLYFKMKQTCEIVFVIDRIGGHLKSYLILLIDFTKKNGTKKETKDQCQL